MRNSRVLRIAKERRLVPCLKLGIVHPSFPDHAIRAAKVHDMDAIVRVSKGRYSEHSKWNIYAGAFLTEKQSRPARG